MLFEPGRIGALELHDRIIRSAVSETMSTETGEVKDELITLYRDLARGGVGLMFAGQMFVEERGRFGFAQTGVHSSEMLTGLKRLTDAVHDSGGKIFAQLAHAGNQSLASELKLIAPAAAPNWMTGHMAEAATDEEIWEVIEAFGVAAQRSVEAGFDGVHIHGANGYLISSFLSPLSNTRDDDWGGSPERRGRLAAEVVKRVRKAVPTGYPVTLKLGVIDEMADGLQIGESLPRAKMLSELGLDAIEVSSCLAMAYSFSSRTYSGVTRAQAIRDWEIYRVFSKKKPEAYFRPLSAAVSEVVDREKTKIIIIGGMRRRSVMEDVLESGDADFVAMGRPFIREPDLVQRLRDESAQPVACTSCNICAMHDEYHALRCWRKPRRNLAKHAIFRFSGGFKN